MRNISRSRSMYKYDKCITTELLCHFILLKEVLGGFSAVDTKLELYYMYMCVYI